jgi:hypothetical protein
VKEQNGGAARTYFGSAAGPNLVATTTEDTTQKVTTRKGWTDRRIIRSHFTIFRDDTGGKGRGVL